MTGKTTAESGSRGSAGSVSGPAVNTHPDGTSARTAAHARDRSAAGAALFTGVMVGKTQSFVLKCHAKKAAREGFKAGLGRGMDFPSSGASARGARAVGARRHLVGRRGGMAEQRDPTGRLSSYWTPLIAHTRRERVATADFTGACRALGHPGSQQGWA